MWRPGEFCVLESVDELRRLIAGEVARGLTLRQSHGAARLAKGGVTGVLEEDEQLSYLARRSRRARLLTECHSSKSGRASRRTA